MFNLLKNKLLIIGAGGHGRSVADIAKKMNRWNKIVFIDDDDRIISTMGIDIISKLNDYISYIADYDIVVAIGNNKKREEIQSILEMEGANIPILLHPSAVLGEEVKIGDGTVVMAGAIINCCSKIGKGCVINSGATIDHDNEIEDYVHISPGVHVAGSVKIGKGTWLGIGSVVSNNILIESGCIVGAGAVVIKDISMPGTYIGIPAMRIDNV